MADSNLADLTVATSMAAGDIRYVVVDPGGTPADRKVVAELVFPSMTTSAMNAISSPVGGMAVYNSDEDEPFFYSDAAADWLSLIDGLPE